MKPPKFHVGQAVVCVKTPAANGAESRPQRGQVVVISEMMGPARDGTWYLFFREHGTAYGWPDWLFAPVELLPDGELAELLAETLEPVTA